LEKSVRITISLTLYHDEVAHFNELISSLEGITGGFEVYFFDNTQNESWKERIPNRDNFHYRTLKRNLSFGKGHNKIIEERIDYGDYHLVVNPDIYFDQGIIEKLIVVMDQRQEVGLIQPKIVYPNGEIQHHHKLLPKPMDLLSRRFPYFIQKKFESSKHRYEMRFRNPDEAFEAPTLSGCFMLMRKEAIRQVGAFDPRFFLYCEDVDLCRRIGKKWRVLYYGKLHIYHHFRKSSYKELRFFYHHVASAIKYFNKYGWWFDRERYRLNKAILDSRV
jgi:GT2 family glycosyltransferase